GAQPRKATISIRRSTCFVLIVDSSLEGRCDSLLFISITTPFRFFTLAMRYRSRRLPASPNGPSHIGGQPPDLSGGGQSLRGRNDPAGFRNLPSRWAACVDRFT